MAVQRKMRSALLGLSLFLIGSTGCRPRAESVPTETGTNVFPARPAIHLVTRVLTPLAHLTTLDDGSVVLDAGLFVYALDPKAPPRRIGDTAAYAPLLQRDESSSLPPDPLALPRAIVGTSSKLEVAVRTPHPGVFGWNGTWTFAPRDAQSLDAIQRAASRPAPMPDLLTERDSCVLVPAADTNATWVSCRRAGTPGRELFVRRYSAWKPVSLAGEGDHDGPTAVARDGSIWLASYKAQTDAQIVRLWDGRLDQVSVPDQAGPRHASYRGTSRPQEVTNLEPVAARRVREMAVARDGTMWILANGPSGDALYRAGGERPASVGVIGSVLDQRAEVEATQPRKRWVGHCDTVFVPIVRGRGDVFPIENLRDPGRREVLARANAVVVGWLGNERVAGPLFTSADDDSRERMIEHFVATLSENPAAAPEPTCTLPVLERTFDL